MKMRNNDWVRELDLGKLSEEAYGILLEQNIGLGLIVPIRFSLETHRRLMARAKRDGKEAAFYFGPDRVRVKVAMDIWREIIISELGSMGGGCDSVLVNFLLADVASRKMYRRIKG